MRARRWTDDHLPALNGTQISEPGTHNPMRTFPDWLASSGDEARINGALTMWCDHPSTKAVTNHVNRASHLRSATNGAMPLLKAMAASRCQHDPARLLALVGPTLGLAARIANL